MKVGSLTILFGLAAAILAPALELATGSPLPYLLILTFLAGLAWSLWKLTRKEFGWSWGGKAHIVAAVYPAIAMALPVLAALVFGRISYGYEDSMPLLAKLGLMTLSTWIGVLITEEGFFRGALWGMAMRAGWTNRRTLIWTSLAFTAWHVGVPIIEEGFILPAGQIPIYLTNVLLLGLTWGTLRLATGSLLVPITAHAVWNGLAYIFFGYGVKTGALGIQPINVYGPERGILGIVVNLAVLVWMIRWARGRGVDLDSSAKN